MQLCSMYDRQKQERNTGVVLQRDRDGVCRGRAARHEESSGQLLHAGICENGSVEHFILLLYQRR